MAGVVNFVYVKWVFLIAVFFERDYGFEIVPVGFYVFLNLFFNLRYPLLVNCRSSRFLQSLCSRNAESTNTDCTSDGLIFGLFLTNCSTSFEAVFFFFDITGQVCVL